jgi:hypothetical protein
MAGRIDPWEARTPSEFVVLLRRAAAKAYSAEADRLASLLDGYDLPPEDLVLDLLRACGMDLAQEDRWMRVYDELSGVDDGSLPPPPPEKDLLRARHAAPGWWSRGKVLVLAGIALAVTAAILLLLNLRGDPALVGGLPPAASSTGEPSAAPPSEEPSAEPSRSPSRVSIPTSGTVNLANGKGFDLDTGLASGGIDVRWEGGVLHAGDNGKRLQLLASGVTPSKQTCSGFVPGQLDRMVSGLTAGRSVCVRTTENRWAGITVTVTGSSLGFTYVVFT